MALQAVAGSGFWYPSMPHGITSNSFITTSDIALAVDQEEFQWIGSVSIAGGGSKTFGTSGSKIDWLPGASITFGAVATTTVGVKKAASIDTANGPPARATIGAAAFDVSKALVGGTDTITSAVWRSDSMTAGTPFTVTDGDMIAVCWLLSLTSGSPSVKIRGASVTNPLHTATATKVTAGPTYTVQSNIPNCILTFDDGTLGWLEPTYCYSTADVASGSIGNGNIFGNIVQVPFSCKIDAIAASINPGGGDFALELYSTPLGTPSLVESVTQDGNINAVAGNRLIMRRLTTARTLTINTTYAIGVKQSTATAVVVGQHDVNTATFLQPSGGSTELYAANSTAAATFAQQNSGKRRYLIWMRVSHLDDGVSAGAMRQHPGMAGGVHG